MITIAGELPSENPDFQIEGREVLDETDMEKVDDKGEPENERVREVERLSRLLRLLRNKANRERRDVTVLSYHVEILIVLDHTIWERQVY